MALTIDRKTRFPDGEFAPVARNNTGIAPHHTVGGTASAACDYRIDDTVKAGNRGSTHSSNTERIEEAL